MVEVAVAALAEAVAGHVDRAAEAPAVEQVGQVLGLARVEQRRGDRVAVVVEALVQLGPVERVDALADAGRDCRRHVQTTTDATTA